jgi:hypothetical protein
MGLAPADISVSGSLTIRLGSESGQEGAMPETTALSESAVVLLRFHFTPWRVKLGQCHLFTYCRSQRRFALAELGREPERACQVVRRPRCCVTLWTWRPFLPRSRVGPPRFE